MSAARHPVRDVGARAYRIPTDAPEADGTLAWSATTAVVVTVHAADVVGVGWTYGHQACVELVRGELREAVLDREVTDVPAAWQAMRAVERNNGRPGLVSCALSAVETALWDAAARVCGLALSTLLGRAHETVPVYGSGGFTSYDDERLRAQLAWWADRLGTPAVKLKIGEARGTRVDRDLRRVRVAREAAGPAAVFTDANGAYSAGQAVRVGRELDALGVTWYEEPVSSDDRAGLRRVRDATAADVAAGEYGYDLPYFATMLADDAVDCLQVDVTRCGGFGEWLRTAALAAARNLDVSGHCAQNLAAHVAAATPNVRHLEWFHDHERIESALFDGALEPEDGVVRPDVSAPGHGMTLKEPDDERYRVR
ncbi:enolase C-terminal domain-like protein [Saccharopolyspora cebuensis]|uniref:Enolase C-terminal domain-like protein n=1 Tax=Saccharopolyspora cebuensis TaxID=418759 RepID=A0ABV4CL78_9PSEU